MGILPPTSQQPVIICGNLEMGVKARNDVAPGDDGRMMGYHAKYQLRQVFCGFTPRFYVLLNRIAIKNTRPSFEFMT